MKCINHKDLCKLLPLISDISSWDIDDFGRLLDKFGDDYFAEGSEFHLVTENKNMKALRDEWERA